MNNNVCISVLLLLSWKEEKNRKVTLPYTWWYRMQCDHLRHTFGRNYISPIYARKFEDMTKTARISFFFLYFLFFSSRRQTMFNVLLDTAPKSHVTHSRATRVIRWSSVLKKAPYPIPDDTTTAILLYCST